MRPGHLERLAPLCPQCLHHHQIEAPLAIANELTVRDGHLIEGLLHCTNRDCWLEFPVIDAVPVIVPDPRSFIAGAIEQILARQDLSEAMESTIGDCAGPGSVFDTTRQHLSLYASDHFADWTGGGERTSQVPGTIAAGLALAGIDGKVPGRAIDLGTSVGRGGWSLVPHCEDVVLGTDLNFAMVRLAQTLLTRREAVFPTRRVGLVYDRETATLPEKTVDGDLDFWVTDVHALPFPAGAFQLVTALNLIDCVASPAHVVAEAARLLSPGGHLIATTPFDWAPGATSVEGWIGGHSQRGPTAGRSEPALHALVEANGFEVTGTRDDLTWQLRVHDRSVMHYQLHMIAARRL